VLFRSGKESGSDRVTFKAGGNVGIGTTSPTYLLNVVAGAGAQNIFQAAQSGISNGYTITSDGTNLTHQWYNNAGEAARLDSSGNLLVGKTSTNFGVTGTQLASDGSIVATRSANSIITLNRLSTDGEMQRFFKDGTQVGSIGTTLGRLYIGNGDVALRFAGDLDFIAPWNASTNAARTDAISLGNAGNRFKDLYLSGNINVDGTVDGVDIAARDADLTSAEADIDALEAKTALSDFTNDLSASDFTNDMSEVTSTEPTSGTGKPVGYVWYIV